MDCADAALPPVARERRLEILKDPRVGAFAVVVEGLALMLRFGALASVAPVAAVVAAVVGRWAMTLTLAGWPPARAGGMGARFAEGAGRVAPSLVALGILLAIGAVSGQLLRLAAASAAGLVGALGAAAWLSSRFGGLTGDAHGAAGVIAETAALLMFLPICGVGRAC
jgi:adenosylcobinamide-GDP ribazoletransferase